MSRTDRIYVAGDSGGGVFDPLLVNGAPGARTFYGEAGNIGAAMAWTFAVIAPFATLLFALGLEPMRRAAQAVEADAVRARG